MPLTEESERQVDVATAEDAFLSSPAHSWSLLPE